MTVEMHPSASGHPPHFFTEPGSPDILMWITGFTLLISVVGVGVLFLQLHSLPERIAHRRQKLQFEIVAVLGLIALFTHIHMFWIAALLLALIELPDLSGVFTRIAAALDAIALNTARFKRPSDEPFASNREERNGAKGELTDA